MNYISSANILHTQKITGLIVVTETGQVFVPFDSCSIKLSHFYPRLWELGALV